MALNEAAVAQQPMLMLANPAQATNGPGAVEAAAAAAATSVQVSASQSAINVDANVSQFDDSSLPLTRTLMLLGATSV